MDPSTTSWRRSDLVPAAILLGLPALLFWKMIFAGEVLYWGTPLLQFFPWRTFALSSYLAGEVPLWNPYLGNGSPFAANWQSAVFYPLNSIYLLFPVERAMGYSVALHVGLAGLFMYVFGRVLGLSRFGSFVAGAAYAMGGFIVSRAGFLSMTSTAPWLPLILAVTERILQRQKPGNGDRGKRSETATPWGRTALLLAWGSLAVGMLLLAGHGQMAFYSLLLVIAYGLYRSWQLGSPAGITDSSIGSEQSLPAEASTSGMRGQDVEASAGFGSIPTKTISVHQITGWILSVLPILGMIFLGLGTAAVQLLPTAELALNSVRSNGVSFEFAMAYSLYPWQLVGLLAPDFFGSPATGDYWGPGAYWETNAYIGVLPLVAAVLALLLPSRHSRLPRLFFFSMAIVSLVFALGNYLPVFPFLFNYVPGFDLFQAPARFLFWYTLSAAVLAGMGVDAILALAGSPGLRRFGAVIVCAGVGLVVAVAAIALLLSQTEGIRPTFIGALARAGVLLAIAGLILSQGWRLPVKWWQFSLGFLVVADLLLFGLPLNPTTGPEVYGGESPKLAKLLEKGQGLYRIYTPGAAFLQKFFSAYGFRTFGSADPSSVRQASDLALPDVAMAWGLQESYNYDPLQVGAAHEFLQTLDASNLDPRLLSLMNVRYVLSDTVAPSSQLKLDRPGPGAVYENPAPLDRAFFVDRAVKVSSSQEALRTIEKQDFDPRRIVILSEPLPNSFGRLSEWLEGIFPAGSSVLTERPTKAGTNLIEYEPQRVVVETSADSAGFLVLSDTYYPGWQAWVNGKAVRIWQADGTFRAIEVPAGRSQVEFRYEPVTFKVGLALSIFSLVLIVSVIGWTTMRRAMG